MEAAVRVADQIKAPNSPLYLKHIDITEKIHKDLNIWKNEIKQPSEYLKCTIIGPQFWGVSG